MKKGYWIVAYRSIQDLSLLEPYGKLAGPATAAFGGKAIIRTNDITTVENGLGQRTVVLEFESLATALAAYNSEAYQAAKKVLGSTVDRDFRIVEGL